MVIQKISDLSGADLMDVMESMSDESGLAGPSGSVKSIHSAISDVVSSINDGEISLEDVEKFVDGFGSPPNTSAKYLVNSIKSHANLLKSSIRSASSPLTERPDYGDGGASLPRGETAQSQTGVIKKTPGKGYCVKSEKNPDWKSGGCYPTREEAEERLKHIEKMKHMK